MKNRFFLVLVLLAFVQNIFPQIIQPDNRPKAYLFSGGETQTERPKPYLFSDGESVDIFTRPRIVPNAPITADGEAVNSVDAGLSLERQAFDLINQQRAKLNLSPLKWSDDVARIARLHSENMATFNFFSHTDLNGLLVNKRADECGIRNWRAIGENIAYNRGYENPVESAVERWMESPSHRENLLNSRWRESGIGISKTKDGTYYFTEVFLVRK